MNIDSRANWSVVSLSHTVSVRRSMPRSIRPPDGLEHPVRVVAEQVGVRRDGFRLQPEAEAHPAAAGGLGDRLQPERERFGSWAPVAFAGEEVESGADVRVPARGDDEELHA